MLLFIVEDGLVMWYFFDDVVLGEVLMCGGDCCMYWILCVIMLVG